MLDQNIIIIVHNQKEQLMQLLNAISDNIDINWNSFVIVDNYSQDGLNEILKDTDFNCIYCDEHVESYATIINTVINEFMMEGTVYVTSPKYIFDVHMVEILNSTLQKEHFIAVSPSDLYYKNLSEYWKSLDLNPMSVLYDVNKLKKMGMLDENLITAENVLKDYIFRAINQKEFAAQYYVEQINENVEYNDDATYNMQQNEHDRQVLKKKWNMNYFNTIPNLGLVYMMQSKPDDKITVLEVGCDCGANLIAIHNAYRNAELYGIEINEDAAKIASNVFNVQTGNIEEENLQYEQYSFDYIIFGDVLEHLHEPERVVSYCRNLLKEDGRIIACIPNLMHYSVMKELLNGNFTYRDTGLLDRTHIHFFTFNEILRLFNEAGYEIENISSVGGVKTDKDMEFVKRMMKISSGAEEHMFTTFQYLVSAIKR